MRTRHAKSAEKRSKPGRIRSVLGALGRDIAREIIPAGAVLPPEQELASHFGVGRGVVREAVKTLSGKGLVSVRPRHGTRVLPRREIELPRRRHAQAVIHDIQPERRVRSRVRPAGQRERRFEEAREAPVKRPREGPQMRDRACLRFRHGQSCSISEIISQQSRLP